MSQYLRTLAVLAVVGLAVGGAAAFAAPSRAPVPLQPDSGDERTELKPFTFSVRSRRGVIVLKVSASGERGSDGTIRGGLYYRIMNPRPGGMYTKRVDPYPDRTDYFLNKPGIYHWQAYRVNCAEERANGHRAPDCAVAGPVQQFRIVKR